MLYTQSDKETKSEGKAIQIISLRLTSDLLQKLNETLDKMGIGALKNGDDRSEKLRKYIEVTHERLVTANPVGVATNSQQTELVSDNWICLRDLPRHPNPAMQQSRCEVCKARYWSEWKACRELKQEKQPMQGKS